MNADDLTTFLQALSEQGIRFHTARSRLPETPVGMETAGSYYPPHRHSYFEMSCLLEGAAVGIGINGRWCRMDTGQVQAYLPGTEHGEHYAASDRSYRMLWTTLLPETLFMHSSSYSPLLGYACSTKRAAIVPPSGTALWETYQSENFPRNVRLRARFHFLLMESVFAALETHRETDRATEDYHEQIVEQVKHYVEHYYWEDLSLGKLASIVHYSPGHLNAIFRKREQMPVHRFINEIRLRKARLLLEGGDLLVKQVAHTVGFRDPLYFSRLYRLRFDERPVCTLRRREPAPVVSVKAGSSAELALSEII